MNPKAVLFGDSTQKWTFSDPSGPVPVSEMIWKFETFPNIISHNFDKFSVFCLY